MHTKQAPLQLSYILSPKQNCLTFQNAVLEHFFCCFLNYDHFSRLFCHRLGLWEWCVKQHTLGWRLSETSHWALEKCTLSLSLSHGDVVWMWRLSNNSMGHNNRPHAVPSLPMTSEKQGPVMFLSWDVSLGLLAPCTGLYEWVVLCLSGTLSRSFSWCQYNLWSVIDRFICSLKNRNCNSYFIVDPDTQWTLTIRCYFTPISI